MDTAEDSSDDEVIFIEEFERTCDVILVDKLDVGFVFLKEICKSPSHEVKVEPQDAESQVTLFELSQRQNEPFCSNGLPQVPQAQLNAEPSNVSLMSMRILMDKHQVECHSTQDLYICPMTSCGLPFATLVSFCEHINAEHSTYPKMCSFKDCKQRFTDAWALYTHFLNHNTMYCDALVCPNFACSFIVASRSDLFCISATNLNPDQPAYCPVQCPVGRVCKGAFSHLNALVGHFKLHHSTFALFKCTICGKRYCDEEKCYSHVSTNHGKIRAQVRRHVGLQWSEY